MAAPKKTPPKKTGTPRKRDAAATKAAILASARKAFAQNGYDSVGLREIAAGAGVTAMLVNRYFGSKEKLFAEVAEIATSSSRTILTQDNLSASDLADRMAALLVDITQANDTPLEGFLIMLRSADSKEAAKIGRKQITNGNLKLLADVLRGTHRQERAAVALAIVAGFQTMRQMLALPALADAKPEVLREILTPLFRELIG
ncbi:MAG: TetR/AcrR family transcriptional regulator [Rhizomicrobium sp.]